MLDLIFLDVNAKDEGGLAAFHYAPSRPRVQSIMKHLGGPGTLKHWICDRVLT